MQRHFTYLMNFFPGTETGESAEKFLFAVLLALALLWLGSIAASRIKDSISRTGLIIPERSFSLFGFFDVFVEGFTTFHDSILGVERRKHLPLCGTSFLFLLCANLLGLVPGFPAVTTTVWINVGMAIVVFLFFNLCGIKEHGVVGYIKHFFASPELARPSMLFVIGLMVFAAEIFSTVLRVLTLNLRLFWNIKADHIVLSVMTDLAPYGVPVLFYFMGAFTAFMQAFVFTVLTMVYILLATQHEEGH